MVYGYATRIVEPSVEPITVDEIKPHLRIVAADTTHDAILPGMISAARGVCESRTQRALLSQKWRFRSGGFPGSEVLSFGSSSETCMPGAIYLPRPRVISIESVKYIDTDGVEQTLAVDTDYKVDLDAEPCVIFAPVTVRRWPTAAAVPNAVTIDYTAGYGATADTVPMPLVQWIIALVAYWFENPKAAEMTPGLTTAVPAEFLDDLLADYIVHHVRGSR